MCLCCNIHHQILRCSFTVHITSTRGWSQSLFSLIDGTPNAVQCLLDGDPDSFLIVKKSVPTDLFTTMEVWEEPTQLNPTHSRSQCLSAIGTKT